jgi:soluble lytic murein transglycosylase-like protein
MLRILLYAALFAGACSMCVAGPTGRPAAFDELIAKHAKAYGLPESFVHRTVKRESGYNPRLVHHQCYGLMQIKYATARGMGYRGDPRGLLDPETNLTYAVPYLANAFKLARGNEQRATALFRSGYYYVAKRKGMLLRLRTASAIDFAPVHVQQAPAEREESPLVSLFSFLAAPARAAPAGDLAPSSE